MANQENNKNMQQRGYKSFFIKEKIEYLFFIISGSNYFIKCNYSIIKK